MLRKRLPEGFCGFVLFYSREAVTLESTDMLNVSRFENMMKHDHASMKIMNQWTER